MLNSVCAISVTHKASQNIQMNNYYKSAQSIKCVCISMYKQAIPSLALGCLFFENISTGFST